MGYPPPTLSVDPKMYRISFLSAGVMQNFPVEGCRGRAATSTYADQIGGLFCPLGRTRVCLKPRLPDLPTLLGP